MTHSSKENGDPLQIETYASAPNVPTKTTSQEFRAAKRACSRNRKHDSNLYGVNNEKSDILCLENNEKEFDLFFLIKKRKIIHIQDLCMYIKYLAKRFFSKGDRAKERERNF